LTGALLDAFGRVRDTAQRYMDERDRAGLGWAEEAVTDISIHKGLPDVRVVQFNRHQEGAVGADYLWWWLDKDSNQCFGMLVQAKRLNHTASSWAVDIRHRGGKQLGDLSRTASYFNVPAMFAIYTGGPIFRRDLPCFHNKEPNCLDCQRMAISIISAYQLWASWESPVDTATMVLNDSIPLENLVDPALTAEAVRDLNLRAIASPELRSFLLHNQQGPREIAKRIFAAVSRQRTTAFSAAIAEPITIASEPIFPVVPRDTGHYPNSYFEHVLRGLRTNPPSYIRDIQENRPTPPEVAKQIAGIVLIAV
jgi:uncharacterized protein DUF6615